MLKYKFLQVTVSLCLNTVIVEAMANIIIRRMDPNPSKAECSEGSYYSPRFERCILCSTCDDYSTLVKSCTAHSDTVCKRCADPSSSDYLDPECKQCPPCDAGSYMTSPCTNETEPVCVECPEGSFNAYPSYLTGCLPCTSCRHKVKVIGCTSSSDNVCGKCKKGYYKDPILNRCHKCRSCYRGQKKIKECKGGIKGKLCGFFSMVRTDFVDFHKATDSIYERNLTTTSGPGDKPYNKFKYNQQGHPYDYSQLYNLVIIIVIVSFSLTAFFVIVVYAACVLLPKNSSSVFHRKLQTCQPKDYDEPATPNSTLRKVERIPWSKYKDSSNFIFTDTSQKIHREQCSALQTERHESSSGQYFKNVWRYCQKCPWLRFLFSANKKTLKCVAGKCPFPESSRLRGTTEDLERDRHISKEHPRTADITSVVHIF